eukprot:COSAG02_NODE_63016_length_264_cov_0.715152_1_plen_59_part_10
MQQTTPPRVQPHAGIVYGCCGAFTPQALRHSRLPIPQQRSHEHKIALAECELLARLSIK